MMAGLRSAGIPAPNRLSGLSVAPVLSAWTSWKQSRSVAWMPDFGRQSRRGVFNNAPRGNATRDMGLFNDELYIGRLGWNRQRRALNPETGCKVSRIDRRRSGLSPTSLTSAIQTTIYDRRRSGGGASRPKGTRG